MKVLLTLIVCACTVTTFAQPYAGQDKPEIQLAKSAGCVPPSTTTFMELNNVKAMIHTAGNLWQVPGQNFSQYEVPKNSGIMALFTSALWLGGVDVNNQLKLAALRYRNGQDYWTGPLTQGSAETNYDNCSEYDRHFITVQDDIREFDAWYSAGEYDAANGTTTQSELYPDYEVPLIIKEWPAHGDVSIGQDYYLAPFFDRNDDGTYNWEDGDYPWHDIRKTKECKVDRDVSLYGDINFWWVMNDKGNIHTETNADPIGMEIRAQAFAFASNDEINNMTFYNYELINRGTQTLFDTYFGCFTDGALGDPFDDYVGCDVNRGLGYYYNGDNYDGDNSGFKGYGYNPPAVGVDFFEGPYQDDDGLDNAFGIGPGEALNGIGYGDSIIDNERYGMRRFLYYSNTTNGANPNQTDPITASDYYNYLRGFWKDGTPFYYGGSGHISDPEANETMPCDFMFPGDTDPLGWGTGGFPQEPWTEQTSGNPPNDRRFVQSAGPFVLKPGAVNNITVGVVWARSGAGDPFASVETLQRADDKAQALFENCFKVLDAPHAPEMSVQELENELVLYLSNPQNSNNADEDYIEFDPFIVTQDQSADRNYRFQGYQIFQLKNEDVAVSDLWDPSKARLAAQCDIKDNIDRIINFDFDESLGASIPVERVDGENEGLRHSFRITEDLFAQGETQLVNFKRYYFMAISYAYNNYKEYDPTDPQQIDGQQKPYIASRKAAYGEIKIIQAIPHNPMPEADGTLSSLQYGEGPIITRLDGFGNGNQAMELTQSSHDYIVANGYMDTPSYEQGKGPINVKVVDPLNVVGGHFECKFRDYTTTGSNGADQASWTIYRYDVEGGTLLDSIQSERAIDRDNEQLIPEWGVSVQIHQENYYTPEDGASGTIGKTTGLLEASITFQDSSIRWLDGVRDNSAYFPTNWIRSGTFEVTDEIEENECPLAPTEWQNPCNYPDNLGVDNERMYDKLINGIVAPAKLVGYHGDYMPLSFYNFGGDNFAQTIQSSVSFAPSVDIVLTSDRSKWTRCPVVELGHDPGLNVGGAEPGELRKSPSRNLDGSIDNSSTGMGWFPGYAIDLETGARLYMAFGENSFLGGENGTDMIWNPTDRLVDGVGSPLMGGMHSVWIWTHDTRMVNDYIMASSSIGLDYPAYIPSAANNLSTHELYQDLSQIQTMNLTAKRQLYGSLGWVMYPLLNPGYDITDGNIPTDVHIRLRVNKEYKDYVCTGKNNGSPMYSWNMDKIRTETGSEQSLTDALDLINVVPNPYKAYSQYENNRLDSRVKITNLPERCTIKIFSTNGKLIKDFKKDSPQTYIDWLLVNNKGIPVASGMYLIYVDVPGAGERVIKLFVAMRQVDLQHT